MVSLSAGLPRSLSPPRPGLSTHDLVALGLGTLFFATITFFAVAQHLTFHTRARDMGIYVQILWNAAQGRPFASTLLEENANHLAEHVAPALWPLVPLAGLAPDAVPLLAIQQAFLAAFAIPVYLTARARLARWSAVAVLLGFTLMPALSRVSLSEFHPIKLAALPVAAGAALVLAGRPRSGALLLLASLLFEEETAPTVAGAGAMMLVMAARRAFVGTRGRAGAEPTEVGARPGGHRPPAEADGIVERSRPAASAGGIKLGLALAVVATVWMLLTVFTVMPGFRLPSRDESENRTLSHYTQVQADPAVVARWLLVERGPDALAWLVLPTGGLALLAPGVLVAALPGFVALFLQDRPGTYAGHWSAPLLPIVWLAAAVALARVQRLASSCSLALVLLLAGTAAAYVLDSYFPGGREFEADHYYVTQVEADLRRAVDLVPPGASFVGTRRVVPHLAARRELYQFPFSFYEAPLRPDGQRQDYYILDLTDSPTRRAIEPAESDSVLEKEPRFHVRRFGQDVLLLSKARPEPSVARGESFGGQVRLVGLDWIGEGIVGVRLYWEAIPRSPADATRDLRLVGPEGNTASEATGQPLGEYLPLPDWERGQVIVEELWLGADASPGPGSDRLLVGWRGRDGRPLVVDGSGGAELELARFERR